MEDVPPFEAERPRRPQARLNLYLSRDAIAKLRVLARESQLDYHTLAEVFIMDRLTQETSSRRRAGAGPNDVTSFAPVSDWGLESQGVLQGVVYEAHSGERADFRPELRRLDSRQVIGHDDRVQFEAGTDRQRIVQHDRYPGVVSTSAQVAADHHHNHLRDASIQVIGLGDQSRPQLDCV
jgi:hypothetical protein